MKLLILIEGLKGSGKTTMGDALMGTYRLGFEWERQRVLHIEPDFFFYDKQGNYFHDPDKVPQSLAWCKVTVKTSMKKNYEDVIIISHKFKNFWEKKYYLDLAKQYGFSVQEIFLRSQFKKIELNKVEQEIKELILLPKPTVLQWADPNDLDEPEVAVG